MKSKKNFEEPFLNVIKFDEIDIITTSGDPKNEERRIINTLEVPIDSLFEIIKK